jgi:tol-pal system beta propeller repeat protein TolB
MLVRNAGQPAWSPDGKKLAFLRVQSGNPDIYTITVDGSGERRLTNDSAEDVDPAWSPDGKFIAFDSKRTGRSQIFVMSADGSNQRRLTRDRFNDQQPRWSPNGDRMVFTSFRNRDPNLRGIGNAEILTATLQGRLRNLTHSTYWEGDPSWSPDGKSVAFAQRRDPGPRGTFAIGVTSATGSQRRLLPRIHGFSNSLANSCCPDWHR